MTIVGIDEVGRGCWAGPVVAAAVILRQHLAGLRDSKQLSKAQRERLAVAIRQQALATGIGWVDAATIDRVGITIAVKWAMERALEQLEEQLQQRSRPDPQPYPCLQQSDITYNAMYDEIIIDGHYNFLTMHPKARAVIKADSSVPAVSAASIIAKVARDEYMAEMAAAYPQYGFERHVGYGTEQHLAQLKLHGASRLHRASFKPIKALLELTT